MATGLVKIQPESFDIVVGTPIEETYRKSQEYIKNSKAHNTIKSYRSDWRDFVVWCERHGFSAVPALQETVGLYITDLAEKGLKTSTIQRRISAISQAHQAADLESPTSGRKFKSVWSGIRRELGVAQKGKKAAVIDDVRIMVDTLPDNLLGIRDRALLLIGFAGAFRRSELVSLNVDDVEFVKEGLVLHLRKSKTDQEGQGRKIAIPYGSRLETCPVRSLQDWLESSGIKEGSLFRSLNRHGQLLGERVDRHGNLYSARLSDKAVARIVKRTAKEAGLDAQNYSGHSLRAGFATTAAQNNSTMVEIMKQTGHRSEGMVRKYIRDASLFQGNAVSKIGL